MRLTTVFSECLMRNIMIVCVVEAANCNADILHECWFQSAAPLPTQLPAKVFGKAVAVGPSISPTVIYVGDLYEAPGAGLAQCWPIQSIGK